jgi:hypothetical protein
MSDPNPQPDTAPGDGTPAKDPSANPDAPPPKSPDPSKPEGVSQAEHDRAVARAAETAKRAAKKELDDYFAEQKRIADEASMDEATRAKAEAERMKAEAAAERAEAARLLHGAKVRSKLAAAGVPDAALDRAVNLVTVGVDATDEELDADIEKLKTTDVPALFGEAPARPGGGPDVKPGNRPANGKPAPSAVEAGREKARAEREAAKSIDPLERFHKVGG